MIYNAYFNLTENVILKFLQSCKDLDYKVTGGKAFNYHTKLILSPDWDVYIHKKDSSKDWTNCWWKMLN